MNYFLPIHNLLRWAVLLFGLWAVISAISGVLGKRIYTGRDNKAGMLFMIFCDIQLLIGLVLYFNGVWFEKVKNGMGAVMKDPIERFFAVEHALMMIIAWLLAHVGRSMVKRADTDAQKHKRALICFGIAFAIIIAMIPWPFRIPGIARQIFPQF
ncbi:MAG TPA: hypothetical protein VK489_00880 [Ferruginibacter sp.]|nr:hypothetical protein [Ferruginibacter sp.]